MQLSTTPELTKFAEDVLNGLSSAPKFLSSKYFYDDEGSRLFQEIMKLPEYYLTGCEQEIFETQSDEIYMAFSGRDEGESAGRNASVNERVSIDNAFDNNERVPIDNETRSLTVAFPPAFDLVELGAGDGTKTAVLIDHFLKQRADISYSPIDISQEALDALAQKFGAEFPALKIDPHTGDYFKILASLDNNNTRRKVLLFLGSNIGNFSSEQSVEFFRSLRGVMDDNDLLFIGFDLQKDPHVIANAYDDAAGVTAKFNLNLLNRINSELGGDFDLDKFTHYANYRPIEGSARSYLMSRERQTVHIAALGRDFEFDQWEAVFMEISQKYSLTMIDDLARDSGFEIKHNFFDSKKYYCDSLWTCR